MYINPERNQSSDRLLIITVAIFMVILIAVVVIVSALHPAQAAAPSEPINDTESTTVTDTIDEPALTTDIITPAISETTDTLSADDSTDVPFDTEVLNDIVSSDSSGNETTNDTENALTDEISDSAAMSAEPDYENYSDVILAQTDDMGDEYINKIVFLGDSTTYGLKYYKMLKDGRDTTMVWTPLNGTLTLLYANSVKIYYPETDSEITIVEAAALKKPEILVITLGVNGVSIMDEESFTKEYSKLINSIKEASPDTKIILQSIFPVADNYERLDSINNKKIDAANEWIKAIARDCGLKYLDTQSVLKGEDGFMINSYQNGDGIHLDTPGFNVVLTYIRYHGLVS